MPAHNFQMSCGALSRGHLSYLQARYYRGLLSRASVNLFKVKDCIAVPLDSSANLFLALIKGGKARAVANYIEIVRIECLSFRVRATRCSRIPPVANSSRWENFLTFPRLVGEKELEVLVAKTF